MDKIVICLMLFGVATSQHLEPQSTKTSINGYSNLNPSYIQGDANYNLAGLRAHQSQNIFQTMYQPKLTRELFSPNFEQVYPAASAGQIKSFQDVLKEENQQFKNEKEHPKSHISVQNVNQGYSYEINY